MPKFLIEVLTTITSTAVITILNYYHHKATRKAISGHSSMGTVANGNGVSSGTSSANPPAK